ncbi:MAG: hypothetical protein AMDU2_EPLC00005G0377 [Thermoplasmatales archaeon E-plasma]|nr:MAG: hypothetical protein AMDU2_EPLC00005G0377 [Thermoplasmatales archaeon E-plasma]
MRSNNTERRNPYVGIASIAMMIIGIGMLIYALSGLL